MRRLVRVRNEGDRHAGDTPAMLHGAAGLPAATAVPVMARVRAPRGNRSVAGQQLRHADGGATAGWEGLAASGIEMGGERPRSRDG